MESKVYFDGYLNMLEWTAWFAESDTNESFSFSFDIPGFVCDVSVYSRLYVRTSSGNDHLESNDVSNMDGPCDGSDGDARAGFPLYAHLAGSWVLVDDDTVIPPGDTEMYWDLSSLDDDEEVYFYFHASSIPNFYLSEDVSGSDHPYELTWTMSEFNCNPYIYSYLNFRSPWTGSHSTGSKYIYPATQCLDGGNITLDVQDDEGNWTSYDSGQGYDYHIEEGTTNFSWELDALLPDYEYELYWYSYIGNEHDSHYEYFTANAAGTESFDFQIAIDKYECNVYFYAYLRPMSEYTGNYEDTESFSFHPQEPCYPPFNLMATDDEGNLTVDALAQDFVLQPGENHLFYDFSHMDNGSEYRLEWYYDDSDGWYGWYYDDIVVDTSDDVADGIHFNMSMDSFDCQAYFFARVYNRTDGQNTNMFDRTRYLQGPCLKPFALQVDGNDFGHDDGSDELAVGDNNLTWVFDNLETGVYYRYAWYWSTGSSSSSQNYYFTYNGSNDLDFVLSVGGWDCNPYTRGSLYYADNGSHIYGNEYFYFHVPDCYNVWMDLLDSDGDYPDSDDIADGANDFSWAIYDLPEGFDYALEMRTYKNGYMHSYGYETFNDSGNMTFDFSVLVDTSEVCDLRLEASLHYLEDGSDNNWYHIDGNSWYFYPDCDDYQSLYPFTVMVDSDGDGNYSQVQGGDNIGSGNASFMIDVSDLADGDYRIQYSWNTPSDSSNQYWQEITSTSSQFEFVVPVTQWDCEVGVYVYLQYNDFRGHYNHMYSGTTYFDTDCSDAGNVSLDRDGLGSYNDNDWSNLVNGTNDMSWELSDLIVGGTYTMEWYVKKNYDFVLYEYETWDATSNASTFSWSFDLDNSTTCNVEIDYRLWVDTSDSSEPNWISMVSNSWTWYPNCDEWVYPDDYHVDMEALVNGSWVADPEWMPSGENEVRLHFENLTEGADYRLYFYYSSTGFPSESNYHYLRMTGT